MVSCEKLDVKGEEKKEMSYSFYFFDFVLLKHNKPKEGERVEREDKGSGGH